MKKLTSPLSILIGFFLLSLFFFYPLLKGHIPFPGDLLVSRYAPYTTYSYNGYAPGGVPTKDQGPDVIKEIYPWKLFSISQLKGGQIPFWNPYNFSGNPLMANFQSNVFYPVNILFFVLPFTFAWSLYIFLTPVLAGWFLYLYLRHKDTSVIAAVFGGMVFAFSSYMVVWIEYGNIGHTLLWLPLGMLLVDLTIETKKLRYPIALVLILLVSFLAGYIQGFFYLSAILFLYTLLQGKKGKQTAFFLLPLFVISLFLGAFQLLPTLSLFTNSSRGGYSLSQINYLLNPWWYMITLFVPDFFGNPATRNFWFDGTYIERVSSIGFIPLVFALSMLFHKQKTKEMLFFLILAGVSLVLTTNLLGIKYFYLIPIPVISTTVPTRMLSVFVFCASVLSGFGLDVFLKQKSNKAFLIALLTSGGVMGGVLFFLLLNKVQFHTLPVDHLSVSLKNLAFSMILLFLGTVGYILTFFRDKSKYLFGMGIFLFILLSVFDLFRSFHKITPFAPLAFVYPQSPVNTFLKEHQGITRSWGYDLGSIESNFQTVDKIYSPEGNDPLHNRQYTEFIMSSKEGKVPEIPARPDANIFNSNTDEQFLHNQYRQKVLNILGVRYVLHKDTTLGKDKRVNNQRFDPAIYTLAWQESPWQIYENKNVAPRIFFTSSYTVRAKSQDILDTLFSSTFDEKKEIVLEKPGPYSSTNGKGDIKLLSYTPNRVTLSVSAETNGYVFLSDVYNPQWKAKIDNKPTSVLRADYAFRAIPIEKGNHIVTMSYQDTAFIKGIYISLATVFVLVGYFGFFRYYKKWYL